LGINRLKATAERKPALPAPTIQTLLMRFDMFFTREVDGGLRGSRGKLSDHTSATQYQTQYQTQY
jgi:hypothetical protein